MEVNDPREIPTVKRTEQKVSVHPARLTFRPADVDLMSKTRLLDAAKNLCRVSPHLNIFGFCAAVPDLYEPV